ncbi:MAG: 4-(cytidine 5'-diphospho)-2-C-methyl-D-erythritol kinase, partial [candidate division KSB1 bacterium]|nr:4-(cytidine 5'-diphospho)-2-C-methyl-D-erythritol kinase [candidate division KSB1 bacterium]
MPALLLFAPAKINLGLAITGRYRNGYHHLETVLVPISLYDRIECMPGGLVVEHRWHFCPDPTLRKSLALGVVHNPLLKKCLLLCGKNLRAVVHKNIPAPAGLGGASSD